MTPNLDATVKDGFNFDQKGNETLDLALISLKIALESYYATYQSFKYKLYIFNGKHIATEEIDFNHSNEYCERWADSIVHFQHFAELACKALLRQDHPLLADIAAGKPNIVHKLLHGQALSTTEEAGILSVEFSLALERLCTLVENGALLGAADAVFILKHRECLAQLIN